MNIGIKIKNLRNNCGMTLKELSEKSGLSIGFLSQLERGLTSIDVDSLGTIADIFKVPMTYFFDMTEKKDDHILRGYELKAFSVENGKFINYCLSVKPEDKSFLPRLVELLPQKNDGETVFYGNSREGEEFIYVLEGIFTIYIDNMRKDLYPGDSIHINSKADHSWTNHTNKNVKVLIVNSPNNFKSIE